MSRSERGARRRSSVLCLGLIVVVAVALAACGKTSSTSSSAAAASSGSSTPAAAASTPASTSTGCGSVPSIPINDQSGLIASLGPKYRAAYNGFGGTIQKSAWSNFKPAGKGPFTIGLLFTEPYNSFQQSALAALKTDLGAIKGVSKVTVLESSPTGVTQQLQQANSLIQSKVTVLVAEPLAPPAFIPVAAAAAKAGIPLVTLINNVQSPAAINIGPNSTADGADSGAALAKLIGGSGTVIGVHGIPSTSVDHVTFAGWSDAFAKCPKITFNTSIVGGFAVPVTKQATLSYLSSHPQPVAGAVQVAGMTAGITGAFAQSGKPIPAQGDIEPNAGDLAYWSAHKATFKGVALVVPPKQIASATQYTVAHLLTGHGPKINAISQPSVAVTAANLSQFLVPGATASSPATVEGPAGTFLPDSYLAPLFNK
jgi:ribose transport system substrate-binding protein